MSDMRFMMTLTGSSLLKVGSSSNVSCIIGGPGPSSSVSCIIGSPRVVRNHVMYYWQSRAIRQRVIGGSVVSISVSSIISGPELSTGMSCVVGSPEVVHGHIMCCTHPYGRPQACHALLAVLGAICQRVMYYC